MSYQQIVDVNIYYSITWNCRDLYEFFVFFLRYSDLSYPLANFLIYKEKKNNLLPSSENLCWSLSMFLFEVDSIYYDTCFDPAMYPEDESRDYAIDFVLSWESIHEKIEYRFVYENTRQKLVFDLRMWGCGVTVRTATTI